MTASSTAVLLNHPALSGLSESARELLSQQTTFLRYRLGQPLCEGHNMPNQVQLIVQGQARLISSLDGRLSTAARLGTGSFVGLASLLRADPCETVSAASELISACFPEELVLKLYESEASFREWCDSTTQPAELLALVQILHGRCAKPELTLLQAFQRANKEGRLVTADEVNQLNESEEVLLASANSDRSLGASVEPGQMLPEADPPLSLRLIALPKRLFETTDQHGTASNGDGVELSVETAPELPPISAQRYGNNTPLSGVKLIRGSGPLEETLACFQMLAKGLDLPFRRDSLEKALRDSLRRGQEPNLQLCGRLAASMGLHVMAARVPTSMASRLQTPALLVWQGGFALLQASNARGIVLASPRLGQLTLTPKEVQEQCEGDLELLVFDRSSTTPNAKFGPAWFWPALKRYRGLLFQVLVASFVVQLFSLANPLLIQVIIDKVISQRSLDTLQVLGGALVVATLMEGVISSLRTFLFSDTTNRIDLRLGAEVIDHLLRLPLRYFDQRPVGDLGTRVGELEKIRNFLTGQALTTILDAAYSVIYIVVMAIYSPILTLIALAVVPIQVGLTVLGAPLFRRQYRQAAEENARTQAHLVEVLTGIQTVKAQNVELVSRWKWQEFYSRYIARSFEKTITGTALNETSQVLQKLSQLLVLWVGAAMVLKGELTLGQLIAFRIISGYVTQPLLRLSSIWQNIQELRVSFERLADVVDTPVESGEQDQRNIPLPPIKGDVKFESLNFSFQPNTPLVLKDINLHIPEGTFVAIVGQSGSGKSTLTKLLSRLYQPNQGRVLVDHYDISKVELYSLRRQIGIVPQDPLLFSGSVSDNIALTDPDAPSDAIVQAAEIACAHDFIMELPSGYSSDVGERGAGLSGGQRQRVAIARTLLNTPKLLVMDEATSALDYDTERRVCENLRNRLKGCTVFFITHRLATIRNADLIVMMHQGAVVETGTHDQLMEQRGRYFALYRQQEAG